MYLYRISAHNKLGKNRKPRKIIFLLSNHVLKHALKKKKVKSKYDFQTWMVNKLNFFDLFELFILIYVLAFCCQEIYLMHRRPSFYVYRMLTLLVLSVFETIYSMIWILAFQVMLATQNEQVKALGKGIHVFF